MQARLYGREVTFRVMYISGFKVPCTEAFLKYFFAGEQFPTDLYAGALTVKEATHDSCYSGLG